MPLAATQEGEASGYRSPALRRGRSSTAAFAMPTTTALSMALVRTRRQSSVSQSAQRRKRKRRAASNQRSNKRKRTSEEEEGEDEVSSTDSSPIRVLHIPDEVYRGLDDPVIWKTIQQAQTDYNAKLARSMTYPTLNVHMIRASMCVLDDPELVFDRESTRKAVLCAAQSLVGISSSVGGKLLARCSGFWIHWDEKNKMGTILTTSCLICTKSLSMNCWLGQEEYDLDAKVLVHLRGDTTEKAHLQYLQKHYDLAFFSVRLDQPVHIPSFNNGVKRADQVLELGRDEIRF